jgi:hypothetical protein
MAKYEISNILWLKKKTRASLSIETIDSGDQIYHVYFRRQKEHYRLPFQSTSLRLTSQASRSLVYLVETSFLGLFFKSYSLEPVFPQKIKKGELALALKKNDKGK